MRKLFIHVILISCVLAIDEELLHYVTDNVPAGSYKYYSLMYDGFIRIQLTSQVGDADLYASQTIAKPTYDPEKYCLQSTTCGEDIIFIPQNFKRPVSIGVYGHPSYDLSRYTLLVYEIKGADEDTPYTQGTSTETAYKEEGSKFERQNAKEKKLSTEIMLEYEKQMFLEVLHEDGLVIAAKGLGIETVFANILKAYLDPGNLVIALGTTDHDERYLIDTLKSMGVQRLPRIVTSEYTSSEREVMYLEGGVLFISGRILVVDLLKDRVPLHLVNGMLVYRAHGILNSYQEAFALRLYRQANKTGFIKAFTNSALAFTVGFSSVERVMKNLFVKKLYLWPRIHAIVQDSLLKHTPEVIELHVKITPKMQSIQTALLDIMNYLIKELKRLNKYLQLDDLTVENAIAKKFHKQLQLQLDPVWHQLSNTSKQLVSDLKTLRALLKCLIYEDCVSFYAMLNRLRTMEYAMRSSGWLVLDVVENLFKHARDRVYSAENELKPEPNPKWTALTEVLNEIEQDAKKRKGPESVEKILLLVQDRNTCCQLKNYLTMGAAKYLLYEALKKLPRTTVREPSNSEGKEPESESNDEEKEEQDSYVLTLTQKPAKESETASSERDSNYETLFEECSQIAELDLTNLTASAPVIVIQCLKKDGDATTVKRALFEHNPSIVVMYVADISALRQLEIYQNNNPSIKLKIFFLVYADSVEEQEYLTSVRREKEAFNLLIKAKRTMVVPEDQDGKSEDCLALSIQSDNDAANEENTRKAGGQLNKEAISDKIIVDMREFRSELPAILYTRGMKIEPVTLLVGDYILTPDVCIERKNISDLIASLTTGRLYNQAIAMTRHYAKPMLLIEFEQNKPFCFQGNYYMNKDISSMNVISKLQLLTLHFPKLKLVWSPNPHATAQLFEELKQGQEQPDPRKAAQIGTDEDTEDRHVMAEKYNSQIQDFIAKLPGVHSKNLRMILNKGQSLDHLIRMSLAELIELVGKKSDAQMLYSALHEKTMRIEQSATDSASKARPKGRGKRLFSGMKN